MAASFHRKRVNGQPTPVVGPLESDLAPDRPLPGARANTWVSRSDSTIVWSDRSRPAKLSRKQAQRHSTDERAKGANEQPVAPEPAAALVVSHCDAGFHSQD